MDGIFDNLFLYLLAMFFTVLKFTGFVSWSWWIVAIPIVIALILQFIGFIANR